MNDIEPARAMLTEPNQRVGVVYHADADGISAAALACAAIERAGSSVRPATPRKAMNVYHADFRRELRALEPTRLVLLDTGSREGERWRDVPTLIVDHHVAASRPDVTLFVHDEAAPSTSVMTHALVGGEDWLAAVGAFGDRGDAARALPVVQRAVAQFGLAPLRDVVALVNATGRASDPQPELALEAMREAKGPREVTKVTALLSMRAEVLEATKRARRAPPKVRGRWAVIEIREACRIHGVIASAWTRRLAKNIVLVANRGYAPGKVHLSVRSHAPIDLRAAMRELVPDAGADYGAGHARATGAIIDEPTYARLLAAIDAAPRNTKAHTSP